MSLSFFLVLSYFLEQIVPGLPSNFSASDQKSIVFFFFPKDPMFLLVVNGMETVAQYQLYSQNQKHFHHGKLLHIALL